MYDSEAAKVSVRKAKEERRWLEKCALVGCSYLIGLNNNDTDGRDRCGRFKISLRAILKGGSPPGRLIKWNKRERMGEEEGMRCNSFLLHQLTLYSFHFLFLLFIAHTLAYFLLLHTLLFFKTRIGIPHKQLPPKSTNIDKKRVDYKQTTPLLSSLSSPPLPPSPPHFVFLFVWSTYLINDPGVQEQQQLFFFLSSTHPRLYTHDRNSYLSHLWTHNWVSSTLHPHPPPKPFPYFPFALVTPSPLSCLGSCVVVDY